MYIGALNCLSRINLFPNLVFAEEIEMGNRLVCMCNVVSENEIKTALKKGATTSSDIQKMTSAGTSCGKCLVVVDAIVEKYMSELSLNPQQKINFGNE
jgi:bacterioferritin-associated ferredoxin